MNPSVIARIASLESQLNALRLQLRGSPGVSTAGGGSLSIRTMQLGFAAELTSCYGYPPPGVTTTTSTTTTSTTTAPPPGPTSTTTTTAAPASTGYCWKRLKLDDAEFIDPTVQLTGCQAFPLDGNQALGPGVVVWLEPSPDAVGWVIVDYVGVSGIVCPTTTTTTSTTRPPCTGSCTWQYSLATKLWTLTSDTCNTNNIVTSYCTGSGISRKFGSTLSGFAGGNCADLNGAWVWTWTAGNTWYGILNGVSATMVVDSTTSEATMTFSTSGGDTVYTGTVACSGAFSLTLDTAPTCSATPSDITLAPVSSSTSNCGCNYPDFCPTCTGTQTTTTNCFPDVVSYGPPPQCNTTTTTLPPTGCTGSCTWKAFPVYGWVKQYDPCLVTCPCPAPTGTPSVCDPGTTSTACVSPPPPPPCTGTCNWKWGNVDTGWILQSSTCYGGSNGCNCAQPTYAGSVCNENAQTLCVGNNAGTTPPPGMCTGRCYWCWNGTAWDFDQTDCVGCICTQPSYSGTTVGEVGLTSCYSPTTTTSTTTTPPTTTTTTTAPPLNYYCAVIVSGGCGPVQQPGNTFCTADAGGSGAVNCGGGNSFGWTQLSGPYVGAAACNAVCPYAGTTTTTTTSTTAPPGVKLWYNGVNQCCSATDPGGGYLLQPGGPYATCLECFTTWPSAISCGGSC